MCIWPKLRLLVKSGATIKEISIRLEENSRMNRSVKSAWSKVVEASEGMMTMEIEDKEVVTGLSMEAIDQEAIMIEETIEEEILMVTEMVEVIKEEMARTPEETVVMATEEVIQETKEEDD